MESIVNGRRYGCQILRLRLADLIQSVFAQLAEKRAAGNAQGAGRFRFVARGADQGLAQAFPFEVVEFVGQPGGSGDDCFDDRRT